MSWASHRKTSREEDLAYSLLGLFDVNMPLLYGEGQEKAFLRLQSEIIKKTPDESIFAWTSHDLGSGMLATHPNRFANSGDISRVYGPTRPQASITNRGVEFSVPTFLRARIPSLPRFRTRKPSIIPVYLNCAHKTDIGEIQFACIQLYLFHNKWFRIRCRNNKPQQYPERYENITDAEVLEDWLQRTEVVCVGDSYDFFNVSTQSLLTMILEGDKE